jgi:molybdopterin-guanine dinucleotide biosynthesis protein A
MRMPQIAGVILAGGAATRIGGEKALLPFAGGTVLDAVIARTAPQLSQLALNVPSSNAEAYRSRYAKLPLLFDSFPERVGPLAGVIAGLEWLRTFETQKWLATFPCDTPFLPRDLVTQLMICAQDTPVFAHHGERLHGVCAVWPLHCLGRLRAGVEQEQWRSLDRAMEALGGTTCLIETDPNAFFNINTREDLGRAEELAHEVK